MFQPEIVKVSRRARDRLSTLLGIEELGFGLGGYAIGLGLFNNKLRCFTHGWV